MRNLVQDVLNAFPLASTASEDADAPVVRPSAAPAEAAAWSILSVSAVSKSSQFFRDRSCHFPMVEGGMEKKSVEL